MPKQVDLWELAGKMALLMKEEVLEVGGPMALLMQGGLAMARRQVALLKGGSAVARLGRQATDADARQIGVMRMLPGELVRWGTATVAEQWEQGHWQLQLGSWARPGS